MRTRSPAAATLRISATPTATSSIVRPSDAPTAVLDPSASPATLAQFANDCQRLFEMLQDDMLQTVAILRVEGYSVDEIATRVGCARRSVERRLQLIRKIWSSADVPEDPNSTVSSQP